ncbi:hypothetical protein BGZ49_003314 [Haplosporangium sp. Z 27]|nr:hypothetical protein BGZ49_003314 [Haplosporangium sp. Z 27]
MLRYLNKKRPKKNLTTHHPITPPLIHRKRAFKQRLTSQSSNSREKSVYLPPPKVYTGIQRVIPGLPSFLVHDSPTRKKKKAFQSPERVSRLSLSDLSLLASPNVSSASSESSISFISNPFTKTVKEPIQTFLRIRPSGSNVKGKDSSYLEVLNSTEIRMNPPPTARSKQSSTYKFTKVFDKDSTQSTIFEEACLPLLIPVLRQEYYHALLFAYGVSDSGKTHSIIGSNQNHQLGILPRALAVVFNSIEKVQDTNEEILYRPTGYQGVETFDATAEETFSSIDILKSQESDLKILADKLNIRLDDVRLDNPLGEYNSDVDNVVIPLSEGMDFTVWVSCAEIFTEKIYDLLVQLPDPSLSALGAMDPKRSTLDLKTDPSTKQKYIHGLKEIRVRTLEEALMVFQTALRQRQVFETILNKASSRSHCIFTIKVLRSPRHGSFSAESMKTSISRLSIIDLAGSERMQNTLSNYQRKKEAGKINTSLMYLSHCMEILRLNQRRHKKDRQQVPYQHSKLTQLFQSVLSGKSKRSRVGLIINVNPCESNFDETTQTLRFSSIAMGVSTTHQASSKVDTKFTQKISSVANQKRSSSVHSATPTNPFMARSIDTATQRLEKEVSMLKLDNQVLANQVGDLYEQLKILEDRDSQFEVEEQREIMTDVMNKLLITKTETQLSATSPITFESMDIDKKANSVTNEMTPVVMEPSQLDTEKDTTMEPRDNELSHLKSALKESEAKRKLLEQELDCANKTIAAWQAWLRSAPNPGASNRRDRIDNNILEEHFPSEEHYLSEEHRLSGEHRPSDDHATVPLLDDSGSTMNYITAEKSTQTSVSTIAEKESSTGISYSGSQSGDDNHNSKPTDDEGECQEDNNSIPIASPSTRISSPATSVALPITSIAIVASNSGIFISTPTRGDRHQSLPIAATAAIPHHLSFRSQSTSLVQDSNQGRLVKCPSSFGSENAQVLDEEELQSSIEGKPTTMELGSEHFGMERTPEVEGSETNAEETETSTEETNAVIDGVGTVVEEVETVVEESESLVQEVEPMLGDIEHVVEELEPTIKEAEIFTEDMELVPENVSPMVENTKPMIEHNEPEAAELLSMVEEEESATIEEEGLATTEEEESVTTEEEGSATTEEESVTTEELTTVKEGLVTVKEESTTVEIGLTSVGEVAIYMEAASAVDDTLPVAEEATTVMHEVVKEATFATKEEAPDKQIAPLVERLTLTDKEMPPMVVETALVSEEVTPIVGDILQIKSEPLVAREQLRSEVLDFSWSPSPFYDYEHDYEDENDISNEFESHKGVSEEGMSYKESSNTIPSDQEEILISQKDDHIEPIVYYARRPSIDGGRENVGRVESEEFADEDSSDSYMRKASYLSPSPPPFLCKRIRIDKYNYDDDNDDDNADTVGGTVRSDTVSRCNGCFEDNDTSVGKGGLFTDKETTVESPVPNPRISSPNTYATPPIIEEETGQNISNSMGFSPTRYGTPPGIDEESGQVIKEEEVGGSQYSLLETPSKKRKRKLRTKKAVFEEEMEETIGILPPIPTKRGRKKGSNKK